MRKILALILSVVFCCIGAQPIFAEEPTENENLTCAVNLLKLIGVLDEEQEESMEEEISRAQFAVYAARIIGINEYAENSTRYYNDIPMKHWALNSINTLAERGIVMQAEDKRFRPDDTISALEAGIILLKIAGYGKYAEYKGGYPNGYSALISETKISDGVKSHKKLSVADACIMIYNALQIGTYQIKEFNSNDSFSEEIDKDSTMLSRYFDMYHDKDVLNATDTVTLNGVQAAENQVVVGTTVYDISGDIDGFGYLGMTVDIFYRMEKNDDNGIIVLISSKKSYNNITEINLRDIDSVDEDYTISYHNKENDKDRRVRVPKNASIICNGVIYERSFLELAEEKNGYIRLVASKNSDNYSVVIVETYKNAVVSHIDAENEKIYLKNWENPIALQEYDAGKAKISAADGSAISIAQLKKDDLVSIFSAEGKIKILRSTQTVQGNVSAVDWEDKTIVIDGVLYDMDWDFADERKPSSENEKGIVIGKSYIFGADINGQIAYIKNGATEGLLYGFLISVVRDDAGERDSIILKVYNERDELVKLNCYDKIRLDGKSVKLDAIEALLDEQQIIRYSTREDGSVKAVDTKNYNLGAEDKYSLHETIDKKSLVYNSARAFSDNKASYPTALMSENTMCFSIPNEPKTANKKDFAVIDRSSFNVWNRKNISAYKTDVTAPYEDVIVVWGGKANEITQKTHVILVESIEEELNEDDEVIEVLRGYQRGKEIVYTMSQGYSLKNQGITCGDIIRIGSDNQGEVNDLDLVFDYSEMKRGNSKLYNEDYMSEHRVTEGRVISKSGNVIRIGHANVTDISEIADIATTTIFVCDPTARKEKIRKGTIDDVLDFESTGNNCSTIVGYTSIGKMDQLYIYN